MKSKEWIEQRLAEVNDRLNLENNKKFSLSSIDCAKSDLTKAILSVLTKELENILED